MKRKGFTLVELLIVIAVLGALTAMMTLSSTNAAGAAKAASIINGLQTLRTAVQVYVAENSAGNPIVGKIDEDSTKSTGFLAVSGDYIDNATFDKIKGKYTVVEGTDTPEGWYAGYAVGTTDTNTISKLKDRATEDGLLGAADGTTTYAGASHATVYMRVH